MSKDTAGYPDTRSPYRRRVGASTRVNSPE
jgi:hypothetical protein